MFYTSILQPTNPF